jgi:NADH dehydrogenase [ubiquinone] 1 alpha subcomplex assembly factor 7
MAGLAERLRRWIADEGPISFAEFMEAALYDPADGFYSRGQRLGPRGAFHTAPTRIPAFVDAVAAETPGSDLGGLVLVEAGPGDGTLARALATRLVDFLSRIILIERAAGMRRLQERALADSPVPVEWVETPEEVRAQHGFVVANELLDDQPVHVLEPPHEIRVGLTPEGRFAEVRAPVPPELLARIPEQKAGRRYAVSPAAEELYGRLLATIESGRVLAIDYASTAPTGDLVRTFVGGRRGGDPLEAPGSQNITADVDFEALRRVARAAGARELAFERLADRLRRHGAAVPPRDRRTDDDWALAALLAEEAFHVLLVEKGQSSPGFAIR